MAANEGDHGIHLTETTRPNGPKLEPGTTAPKHIQVFILPTDGEPDFKNLPTIDTSTKPPSRPASLEAMTQATTNTPEASTTFSHTIKPRNKTIYRPDIRIQPCPHPQYWSSDAWAQRVVVDADLFHILFTVQEDDGLRPNRWLGGRWRGDAFIVKVSGTKDSDGPQVYVDVMPGATPKDARVFMKDFYDRMLEHLALKAPLGFGS